MITKIGTSEKYLTLPLQWRNTATEHLEHLHAEYDETAGFFLKEESLHSKLCIISGYYLYFFIDFTLSDRIPHKLHYRVF